MSAGNAILPFCKIVRQTTVCVRTALAGNYLYFFNSLVNSCVHNHSTHGLNVELAATFMKR